MSTTNSQNSEHKNVSQDDYLAAFAEKKDELFCGSDDQVWTNLRSDYPKRTNLRPLLMRHASLPDRSESNPITAVLLINPPKRKTAPEGTAFF
jgi:hypothetical protein